MGSRAREPQSGLTLSVTSSESAAKAYQRLLTADWDIAVLDEVLDLVRDLCEGAGVGFVFPWEAALPLAKGSVKPYPIPKDAPEYLAEFMERLNASIMPDVPERLPQRTQQAKELLGRRAMKASVFLSLQGMFSVADSDGFLRDVQSLLFNLCIHVLLEDLGAKRMREERNHLLNVLYAHTIQVWNDDLPHQIFLKSQLYEYAGDQDAALDGYRMAFQAAEPADHDFLTKAQIYWSRLIDQRQLDTARAEALRLYRIAPHDDLREVETMIDDTYALLRPPLGRRHSRFAGGY